MRVLVAVPSRSRAHELESYTYSWLQFADVDYRIFVEPQQEELYKDFNNIVLLDKNDGGLGYATHFAKKYAVSHGYDIIFKLDDDVGKFITPRFRFSDDEKKDKQLKAENNARRFERLLAESTLLLERNKSVGAIGYPYRNEMFDDNKLVEMDKKLQTCYMVRLGCYEPEPDIQSQEDFVTTIKVVKAGYKTLRFNKYGIDLSVPVGAGQGGIQDFDRETITKQEMAAIKQMFPGTVFKYKPNRPWKYEIDFAKSNINPK